MIEIEGEVDATGSTIQVDNTKQTEKLRQAAEYALSSHDWVNVDNYYSKIFEDDPTDWEAAFFPTYARAITCKIMDIEHAANSVKNCLATVVYIISDSSMSEEDKTNAVAKLVVYVKNIGETFEKTACEMLNNAVRKELDIKEALHDYVACASAVVDMLFTLGSALETCFPDNAEISVHTVAALKAGMQFWADYHRLLDNWYSKKEDHLKTYGGIIRKYEPEYLFPAANHGKYLQPFRNYTYAERDKSEKELAEEAEIERQRKEREAKRRKQAEEIARQQKEEAKARAKKRRPIIIAIVAAITVFLIIGIVLVMKNNAHKNAYNEAVELLEKGIQTRVILPMLQKLNGYRDSDELIDMINEQIDKMQGKYISNDPYPPSYLEYEYLEIVDDTMTYHIKNSFDEDEYVNVIYLGVSIDVGSKTVTGVGSFEEPDSLYGGFRVFEVNDDYSELSTPWVGTPFIKRP